MLTTFVIGLREGLEASLIVGIIAAFLKRNGAGWALRQMWLGVAIAVGICLAGGVVLAVISAHLPQRQQEMLECVVAGVAVVMVTYMILWMNAHSRGLKGDLESAAAGALARGSAWALVAMAFLAVLREGFETSVFLLAAFDNAISPASSAIGVILGIGSALVLGYLIYRGGTRINLSRFFRLTGIVLVLVAGGLVMSTLRAAHEATWLTAGQQSVVDLSWLVRPGSVQSSLLGGILGIQPHPAVVEVTAWALYVGVMLTVVLWPRKRRLTRPAAARFLLVGGAGAAVVGLLLAVVLPAPAGTSGREQVLATSGQGTLRTATGNVAADVTGSTAVTVSASAGSSLVVRLAGTATGAVGEYPVDAEFTLDLVGSVTVGAITASQYVSAPQTSTGTPAGSPSTLTGAEIAQLNGGRRPIGLSAADTDTALPATYVDSWRATVTFEPVSGVVLDAEVRFVRAVQVTSNAGVRISAGTVAEINTGASPAAQATQQAAALDAVRAQQRHESWGQVIPAVLGLAAAIVLAFGVGLLLTRTRRPAIARPLERVPASVATH